MDRATNDRVGLPLGLRRRQARPGIAARVTRAVDKALTRVQEWMERRDGVRTWAMVIVIVFASLCVFVGGALFYRAGRPAVSQAASPPPAADVAQLEDRVQHLEAELGALAKSHALAVKVSHDLDERLARLEGRKK